jgi:hypothetical protein
MIRDVYRRIAPDAAVAHADTTQTAVTPRSPIQWTRIVRLSTSRAAPLIRPPGVCRAALAATGLVAT